MIVFFWENGNKWRRYNQSTVVAGVWLMDDYAGTTMEDIDAPQIRGGEVVFDHMPTSSELDAAFPDRLIPRP